MILVLRTHTITARGARVLVQQGRRIGGLLAEQCREISPSDAILDLDVRSEPIAYRAKGGGYYELLDASGRIVETIRGKQKAASRLSHQ